MNSETIQGLISALSTQGFEHLGREGGRWIKFSGALKTGGGEFGCELRVDKETKELPLVRLTPVPDSLKPIAPHIDGEGGLCYAASGAVVFDIFNPIGQILLCLARAEFVLDKVLRGEMVEDLEEEFYAYWGTMACYEDVSSKVYGTLKVLSPESGKWCVISDDVERTKKKLSVMGLTGVEQDILVIRIGTTKKPKPSQKTWPPTTVGEVLSWQSLLDRTCRKKIERAVEKGYRSKSTHVFIVIDSPLISYGFLAAFDRTLSLPKRKKRVTDKQHIYAQKIIPVHIVKMGDRYVVERNIPGQKTLAGYRIGLIGCGTIGGYLAEMLVKAGAGADGGEVILVDDDVLGPQNLGRHRLGFAHLFGNKAVRMVEELERVSPGAQVKALPVDAREAFLDDLDLLIDATGEESFGDWLAAAYHAKIPILSVWIEGAGIAVRTLLSQGVGSACYRCLNEHTRDNTYESTIEKIEPIFAGQGCEGLYVPFPASVSVQAASLASDAALDWAAGEATPRLRTRLLKQDVTLATPDCNPEPFPECPACN